MLAGFSEPTRAWFEAAFAAPTPAQVGAWAAISARPQRAGRRPHRLRQDAQRVPLVARPARRRAGRRGASARCRVLYVSPLKALAVDVERNLRAPLTGIRHTAARLGLPEPDITVGRPLRRHPGQRAPAARHRAAGHPHHHPRVAVPDAHLAGPGGAARRRDRDPRRGARRGRHQARRPPGALASSGSTRSSTSPPSASASPRPCAPIEEVARFLGGSHPVEVVAPGSSQGVGPPGRRPGRGHGRARLDRAADSELEGSAAGSPSAAPRSGRTSRSASSTSSSSTARRSSSPTPAASPSASPPGSTRSPPSAPKPEPGSTTGAGTGRRCRRPSPTQPGPPAQLMAQSGQSDGAAPVIARAHHGSVSKEQRALIEDDLKRGRLPCVVATSSLELGIDMGAVDLVVQIESPPSVASALQRVGRAGHQVGEVSRGVLLPKHRADLVHTAVAVERMRTGRDRVAAGPGEPARRARPAGGRGHRRRRVGRRRPVRPGPPGGAVLLPAAQRLRRDPRPALGALPQRRVRRAAPADRVGPRHRRAHRPARGAAAGGDQRRHDPGPRPVRGVPGRREGQPGRRARRGDGLRVPGRRRVRARGHQLADRGHHPRPGAGLPRPGTARPAAVLEGRPARPPRGARARDRRVHPGADRARARRGGAALPRRRARRRGPRTTSSPSSTSSARRPPSCPATGRSWSSGSATSSATGGW